MDYRERFAIENEAIQERYELAVLRISSMMEEKSVKEPYRDYFIKTAKLIMQLHKVYENVKLGVYEQASLEQLQKENFQLYEELLEAYESSYGNPVYAVKMLGEEYGKSLCFLYAELRSVIGYLYEQYLTPFAIRMELFIEIYNLFEDEFVTPQEIEKCIYWFISDYSDEMLEHRIAEQLDPTLSFAKDMIMEADLTDVRYLYRFGEYVSDNELRIAKHLNSLPQEEIDRLASVFTEGFRIGFVNSNKDLSKKKIVNIRYHLGFERIIRQAIINFEKMGLASTIYRCSESSVHNRVGYEGAIASRQYLFDHKNDRALYLDKAYVERRLGALKNAYEIYKEQAAVFAGPAVMEVFGEEPFAPVSKTESLTLSAKQQKLAVEMANASGQLVNQYIPGEERSFTIIAFPLPEIGEPFDEIFNEIVKINTLDYKKYQTIQQTIIDALDQGEYVHVQGMNGNRTDLKVYLQTLQNPDKETIFENCVADVNIPVGEVFTSPKLTGTSGTLHVSKVFLNELEYQNLEIVFKDGMICDYNCTNFEDQEKNKKYVKENVLFHHDSLPLGEFAIGTNTTAYVVTQKYNLAPKMPILIAEKMGPHFAVGDTCYSWQEDTKVYNPDGKEIIARDNECSILRKEDVGKAYFNCHTDITIPYDELGCLCIVTKTNKKIEIIKEGRFVLAGTENLNDAFYQS